MKTNSITKKQKDILIDYISSKKDMYSGKLTPNYTKEQMQKNWQDLTNILNSVPEGPAKDWKQWRKTWVDLKKNIKAKYSDNKKYNIGTGGGPPMPPLESIENKILNIITPTAIRGDDNIKESLVNFDFETIVPGESQEIGQNDSIDYQQIEKEIIGEEIFNPHDYCASTLETPSTSKQAKKNTKVSKLQESIKNNEKFLKISQENLDIEIKYKEKKIEIMEQTMKMKENYYNKKITLLQEISTSLNKMASKN